MTTLEKILIAFLVLLTGSIGAFGYFEHKHMLTLEAQVSSSIVAQKQLIDGITRSSTNLASKDDLNALAQQQSVNIQAIQKDLDTLGATISGLNVITVNSTGQTQTNVPSTGTTPNSNKPVVSTVDCNGKQIPCPDQDKYGYLSNIQTLALNEDFATIKAPIGSVSFDASAPAPWSINIVPRQYNITNTLGTNPQTGEQYVYNQLTIRANDKDYIIPITSAKFEQQTIPPSFSFWNPHLFLSAGASIVGLSSQVHGAFVPGITLGIASYGSSKANPDISILQVGLGYAVPNNQAVVILNPISFNLHNIIPGHVADRVFLGPSMQFDGTGSVYYGATLNVGF